MDLLKDLKMQLLNLSFIMIYTIHKILVLIKNQLNYFFFFLNFFSKYIIMESLSLAEEIIIKGVRDLFILKKRYKKTYA